MVVIVILNTLILFTYTLFPSKTGASDPSEMSFLEKIDFYLNYVYLVEFVIKILGLGILNYFRDNWNCFDFFIMVVSFGTDTALGLMLKDIKSAKSAKAAKVIKLTKA